MSFYFKVFYVCILCLHCHLPGIFYFRPLAAKMYEIPYVPLCLEYISKRVNPLQVRSLCHPSLGFVFRCLHSLLGTVCCFLSELAGSVSCVSSSLFYLPRFNAKAVSSRKGIFVSVPILSIFAIQERWQPQMKLFMKSLRSFSCSQAKKNFKIMESFTHHHRE